VPAPEGHCDPRFTSVRAAFRQNFAERGEQGAALTLHVDGRVVADLWGGWSDQATRRPWRPDTLVNVFSVGKGLLAAAAAQLIRHNAYFNPGGLSGSGVINSPGWRAAEVPSANAHGTARGIARVYAALAAGGRLDGTTIVDAAALADATAEQVYGPDLVLNRPSRFGLGFQLTQPERPLGPGESAFGHFGAGGSLGFCDPDAGLAFGYVMNQMGPRWQNPRTRALIDAAYACL
jgi:CubicO group peptidase (beta-lactamase class C family)